MGAEPHGAGKVLFGTFDEVLKTKDFTPLESDFEHTYYARGVGLILEVAASEGSERVELVEKTPP